jgi:hypothetical protein
LPLVEGCGLTTDRQEMTPAPIRIDVRRGVKALLFTLVLPVTLAVFIDVTTGTLPWLTIAAAILCIPLATIVVNRTVLAEFGRVVAIVAPEEDSTEEDSTEEPEDQAVPAETVETTAEPAGSTVVAGTDSIANGGPLDGMPLTEGAQKHHG